MSKILKTSLRSKIFDDFTECSVVWKLTIYDEIFARNDGSKVSLSAKRFNKPCRGQSEQNDMGVCCDPLSLVASCVAFKNTRSSNKCFTTVTCK